VTPRPQNNRTVTRARVPTVLIVDHRRRPVVNVNVVIATSPRRHLHRLSRVIIVTIRDELQRWMKVAPIDLRNLRALQLGPPRGRRSPPPRRNESEYGVQQRSRHSRQRWDKYSDERRRRH